MYATIEMRDNGGAVGFKPLAWAIGCDPSNQGLTS